MKTFDIGRVLTLDELKQLRGAGFEAAALYLDPYNAKGCTEQYLRDIYAAGLRLAGFFYQTTGGVGQPLGSYHTRSQGQEDARQAEMLLENFAAAGLVPAGVVVWYVDDTNIPPDDFDDYATGIEDVATGRQTPGIYGFQRLCDHARLAYPNMGRHLAQTYGTVTGSLDLWQHEQVTIEGITVDIDDANLPGWSPTGDGMSFKDDPDAQAFVQDVRNFIDAVNKRLAIDAHHGHDVTIDINTTQVSLPCSEPRENRT